MVYVSGLLAAATPRRRRCLREKAAVVAERSPTAFGATSWVVTVALLVAAVASFLR